MWIRRTPHRLRQANRCRVFVILFQQKNILDNHLNNLMIDHNGQADSITSDEIIGAYEIPTIHNGHPSYFLCGWEEKIN